MSISKRKNNRSSNRKSACDPLDLAQQAVQPIFKITRITYEPNPTSSFAAAISDN